MNKARPITFIVLQADGKTNMGRSVRIIKIIISNSRVSKRKKNTKEKFLSVFILAFDFRKQI